MNKYIATNTFTRFDVTIEPKFVPGERQTVEKYQSINMIVYARDINEAITVAKDLVNLNTEDVDVISACKSGRCSYVA